MKITLRCAFMLLSTLFLATSCLNTDDTEYTYYNDTAITAFSLGTLNRYYQVRNSAGDADSTCKATVTGSDYEFYIDQTENRIYNNDSLPKGTDTEHVICTVSSLNSGIVLINYKSQANEDSLVYYSSSDSIDFSEEREFRVYATDGSGYRKYTVNVNAHEEDPDTFRWHKIATVNDFKGVDSMKLVGLGSRMVAFCRKDSTTTVYTTDCSDGVNWDKRETFDDANVVCNTAVLGETLYIVSEGELKSTTDGITWSKGIAFDKKLLAGAGSKKLYALDAGKIYSSADKGLNWDEESVDEADNAGIPDKYVSLAALENGVYDDTENLILTGLTRSSTEGTDTATVVWGKTEEYAEGSEGQSWVRYESEGGYTLPAMTNVSMIRYGNVLLALGGSPLNGAETAGFTYLYMSRDKGLTWQTDTRYVLPSFSDGGSDGFGLAAGEDINYSTRLAKGDVPAVKDNMLWIISGGTGEVWRGRLNELGWRKYDSSFTE